MAGERNDVAIDLLVSDGGRIESAVLLHIHVERARTHIAKYVCIVQQYVERVYEYVLYFNFMLGYAEPGEWI